MFNALASLAQRHGKRTVIFAAVFFVIAGALGGGVASKLAPYGDDDPATESVKAADRLEADGYRDPSVIVLFQNTSPTSSSGQQRIQGVERQLRSDPDVSRVTGYLESGKSDGATAQVGGGRYGDRGYFVEPTVLTNTRPEMKVVREEIFGPVLVAAPFTDLDEIAAVANDSEYGLGAGIWTRDISKAHALAKKLRAGTVWINCYNVFDAALPFGGYKQSGWGREMGHEALHAYTEVKAVTTQL